MESYAQSSSGQPIYPVYILKRVVDQLINYCYEETPNEALGILIGWHYELPAPDNTIKFSKIIDWVTGEVAATHVGAQFTSKGLREYKLHLDEKYGKDRPNGPYNIGLFHSHPFGHEPHFSSVDYSTFLNFPYNAENNVFILIDPVPDKPYFKVFQIRTVNDEQKLLQVPWVEYSPVENDFRSYIVIESNKTTKLSEKDLTSSEKIKETQNSSVTQNETSIDTSVQKTISDNEITSSKNEQTIIGVEEGVIENKTSSGNDPFFDFPTIEDLSVKKKKNQPEHKEIKNMEDYF